MRRGGGGGSPFMADSEMTACKRHSVKAAFPVEGPLGGLRLFHLSKYQCFSLRPPDRVFHSVVAPEKLFSDRKGGSTEHAQPGSRAAWFINDCILVAKRESIPRARRLGQSRHVPAECRRNRQRRSGSQHSSRPFERPSCRGCNSQCGASDRMAESRGAASRPFPKPTQAQTSQACRPCRRSFAR